METENHTDYQLRNLHDVFKAHDILKLEDNIDISDFDYSSKEQLFKAAAQLFNITVIGSFTTFDSMIRCKCNVCGILFDKQPRWIQRYGCPQCKLIKMNKKKSTDLWTRSCQIIDDKRGKIIRLPDQPEITPPTVKDTFGIECAQGHKFQISHRQLAADKWCPICHLLRGNSTQFAPTSSATYSKSMTVSDKFDRHKHVAGIKGAKMISAVFTLRKYDLECIKCQSPMQRTGKQILENKYLCKNKCIQGTRHTLYSKEWKTKVDERNRAKKQNYEPELPSESDIFGDLD